MGKEIRKWVSTLAAFHAHHGTSREAVFQCLPVAPHVRVLVLQAAAGTGVLHVVQHACLVAWSRVYSIHDGPVHSLDHRSPIWASGSEADHLLGKNDQQISTASQDKSRKRKRGSAT